MIFEVTNVGTQIATELTTLLTNMTTQITYANVATIIGGLITAGLVFVLLWRFARWGVRKLTSMITRGKASV